MSGPGSVSQAMANGMNNSGRLQVNPAELVRDNIPICSHISAFRQNTVRNSVEFRETRDAVYPRFFVAHT